VGTSASAKATGVSDMAISVSDSPDPVFVNSYVTYQAGVSNRGPDGATGVVITAQLPTGVRFEPNLSNSECAADAGIVTCAFASWDANAAGIVLVTVSPAAAGTLELAFAVAANEPDPDLSNNSQTVTTEVLEPTQADVSLGFSGTAPSYPVGEPIRFAINVGNAGPATATGVTATLRLSPGLTAVNAGSCVQTDTGTTCTFPVGSLPPGTGVSGILEITATTATRHSVQGTVTADQPDPDPSNNSASFGFAATSLADLAVQVTESGDPATPGLPLTYTATVVNLGPSTATDVEFVDTWSTTIVGGVQLLSFTASGNLSCTRTADQGIDCATPTLSSGESATVTITLRPLGAGSVSDLARVGSLVDDPVTSNNHAAETTTVGH
jgi:uncharacterized repeat protein (TIGR01451 family)